jgi:hypothetical protein
VSSSEDMAEVENQCVEFRIWDGTKLSTKCL